MSINSKIKSALKNPRKALELLILGNDKFNSLYNSKESCFNIENALTPLESRMILPTDIHEHLATLHFLTVEFNLKNILELGVRSGESTIAFLQAAKEINGKVTSIDVNPCIEAKDLVQNYNLQNYWTFIQGNDMEIKWDKPIDHLFIDTSHEYQHTFNELVKYEPIVRDDGIITMHDIVSYPGVQEAINDYLKERPHLRFYKYFNNNGLGILKKKKRNDNEKKTEDVLKNRK